MQNRPHAAGTGTGAGAHRGSVLLVVLVFSSLLALLSASFQASVHDQIQIARGSAASLHAQLAAQSGLEFALSQLAEDPDWEGTGGAIPLDTQRSFAVSLNPPPDPLRPEIVELVIEGRAREATHRLLARAEATGGDPLKSSALASLGGLVKVHGSDVLGSMLIVDALGKVMDWNPTLNGGEGGWELGGASKLGMFQFSSVALSETLFKYSTTTYFPNNPERTLSKPVYMPAWSLEEYLQPGPDRVIFDHPGTLKDLVLDETAVVVMDPGETLFVENAQLHGGLVVYVEETYNLRNGPQHSIVLKKDNVIGGGEQGIHPHIGLIAPASYVRGMSGQTQAVDGFSMWNEMFTTVHFEILGTALVVNAIRNLDNATLIWDPEVAANLPNGFKFGGGDFGGADLLVVHELFEPVP